MEVLLNNNQPYIFFCFILTFKKFGWNVQMNGAIITALPTLIVYLIFGRYFIEGLLSGSVKG